MRPVNKSVSNCSPQSSQGLVWRGVDIPCIGVYRGDHMDDMLFTIAEELCKLEDSKDLSSLTVQDLIKVYGKRLRGDGVVDILNLMVENNTTMRETLDQLLIIVGLLEGGRPFTLKTSCLGKGINTIEKTVRQLFITLCSLRSSVQSVNDTLASMQLQLNSISYDTTLENVITTCIATDQRVSNQTILTSEALCTLQRQLGTLLLNFCGTLETRYGSDEDWISPATTWADGINNLNIIVCEQERRLVEIETGCCTFTCDDVLIGFSIVKTEDNDGLYLRFREVDGTTIPEGFTDCGSKITITDYEGNAEVFPVELEQDLTTDDLILSTLKLDGIINITIDVKVCSDVYSCSQCVGTDYDYGKDSCPVCLITTEGTEGYVTIIYEV